MVLVQKAKLAVKRKLGKPDYFLFLKPTEHEGVYWFHNSNGGEEFVRAEQVGKPRSVVHLIFPDMDTHAIRSAMTDMRYLEGLQADAVVLLSEEPEHLYNYKARTWYQPLRTTKPGE